MGHICFMLCVYILYISILTHAPPSPPFLTFGARHSHGCGRLYACSPPGGTQCPPFTVLVLVINTHYYYSGSKSARRLPPPWPRAPALPRPASRQHQQAALASSTRASAQPSASLPCGGQHEQRLRTRPCARPSTPWSGSNRGKGCGSGRQSDGEAFACDSVCVCVARACACAQVYVTYTHSRIQSHSCLCVRLSSRRQPLLPCPPVFCDLAVLGAVGGGLASSAHEWLLQRLGAVTAQRGIAAVALGRCVLRPWHLDL